MPLFRLLPRVIALLAATAVVTATVPAAALDPAAPPALWVVTYATPPAAADLDALRGAAGNAHAFAAVPAAVVAAPGWLVPVLRRLPGVRGVWANERYRTLDSGSNATTRADEAWGTYAGNLGHTGDGATGAGIGIGVIDAGVDGTHPDLCGLPEFCRGTPVKTVQNVKFIGNTDKADPVVPVEDVVNTDNSSGHGSHVAGIAAGYGVASTEPGRYQGVAPGAHLVGLGAGEGIEVVNVLAGFDYAISHRDDYNIRVLNNSWGPGAGTPYDPEHPVNRAIDAAWDAGISVVFGAGNDGPRTDSLNMFSAHPRSISVAATRKDGHLAFFSSRGIPGSPLWRPTVAAPGENIVSARALFGAAAHASDATSANPEPLSPEDSVYYANSNGTSMAAPHVSGVVALMQQAAWEGAGRYLTPAEVKAILQATAASGGAAGLPNYQGYTMGAGLVDAAAAVAVARTGVAPAYDDGLAYDVRPFAGTVGPAAFVQAAVFTATVDVAPGAVSLDVMADWTAQPNDVDITVYDPAGANRGSTQLRCDPSAQPNGYSSFCSSAPNERLSFRAPAAGTWRVVVGALANSTENVRGLWSVAYPDAVAPVATGTTVATVTVAAATPAGVQGQGVGLTATARDAAGLPVPNATVTWTSAGAGGVTNAETLTGADGVAVATALAGAPGTQHVTMTAGGAVASTTVTWLGVVAPVPPAVGEPADTAGSASGGGWFSRGGAKARFGVSAELAPGATAPGGALSYDDRSGLSVASDVVERFRVSGATAVLSGPAWVNGAGGYRYRLTVTDNGEPGTADTVRLELTQPASPLWSYTASGTLGGGNLQVRAAS